jgi:hypothetical protein
VGSHNRRLARYSQRGILRFVMANISDEVWFRAARISLLQFWVLPNEEKVRYLPRPNRQVRYYISDSTHYSTDPLKYLAIQSTFWLDFIITDKAGELNGASKEAAFLLSEMLSHPTKLLWQIAPHPDYSFEEEVYWQILSRLARTALDAMRIRETSPRLSFEELSGASRRQKKATSISARPQNEGGKSGKVKGSRQGVPEF